MGERSVASRVHRRWSRGPVGETKWSPRTNTGPANVHISTPTPTPSTSLDPTAHWAYFWRIWEQEVEEKAVGTNGKSLGKLGLPGFQPSLLLTQAMLQPSGCCPIFNPCPWLHLDWSHLSLSLRKGPCHLQNKVQVPYCALKAALWLSLSHATYLCSPSLFGTYLPCHSDSHAAQQTLLSLTTLPLPKLLPFWSYPLGKC